MERCEISVVAPVFNEQDVLKEFYVRIKRALADYSHEILFLDDGSRDRSWEVIEQIAMTDPHVQAIGFSRNFGHQAALTAGLENASGEAVVLIDSDLQDPPELIPEMIRKHKEGYDVVYAVRSDRKGESAFKKATASAFYRALRFASSVDIPLETGDFRLLSRQVVDAINRLPERVRFLRGLSSWVGFRQTGIPYSRDKRYAGKTKFTLLRMVRFAFDGITSLSSMPLQIAIYLGFAATALSLLYAAYSLWIRLFTDTAVKGWTSLVIVIVFMGGIQLLMIGLIGEYIGRIYEEVKRRPLYLVQRSIPSKKEEAGTVSGRPFGSSQP